MSTFVSAGSYQGLLEKKALPPQFKMPLKENENYKDYVTSVNEAAPFDYVTVGGVVFHKYVISPESSYLENLDKPKSYRIPTMKLTKTQAKELKKHVLLQELVLPAEPNLKFIPGGSDLEWIPAKTINVGKFITIMPVEEYKVSGRHFADFNEDSEEITEDTHKSPKERLYEAQRKKGK